MSRLPDFLLIGAMRAGTTSLHGLLGRHPGVCMPEREVFFFDSDDFEEHAEEHVAADGSWRRRDFDDELAEALPAYQDLFSEAGERVCGERSTTYLTALDAPGRAARLVGDARVLVMLRDPVARAWSHYWHLVGSGRMVLDFEAALISQRGTLLKRSTYAPALARWLAAFPRRQVHVVLFEDFVADPQRQLDEITRFLGLKTSVDLTALSEGERHRHRAAPPARPAALRAANWLGRRGRLPTRPARLAEALAGTRSGPPPMPEDTRRFLDDLLGRANAGLPDLLGRDLSDAWPCLRGGGVVR